MTLLIVYPSQFYVCCTRSGVIRCTLFTVLYLWHISLCGLRAVLCWRISILMHFFTAEPCRTTGPLLPCQYICGTILVTSFLMVWDEQVKRAGPSFFIGLAARPPFASCFPFLFFLLMGWYCWAEIFWLIGCYSLFQSLALPIFLNNNKIISVPWYTSSSLIFAMNATDHINVVFHQPAYNLMGRLTASSHSIITAFVNSDAHQQSPLIDTWERMLYAQEQK